MRSLVTLVTLLVVTIVLSRCGQTETYTSIRVTSTFNASWDVTQLAIESKNHSSTEPPTVGAPLASGTSIVVVLSDEEAGKQVDFDLWGLAEGKRIAIGKGTAIPLLHQVVDVQLPLTHLPCGAWCSAGSTACSGDAVEACVQDSSNSCMSWGKSTPCGGATPYCSLGQCSATCVDECSKTSTRCLGSGAVQRCGQADSDPCLDWLPEEMCGEGTTCQAGVCTSAPCKDECALGATQCSGEGVVTCGNFDADGCLEWGPETSCAMGQSCSNGVCSASCTDECSTSTCSGLQWDQCGQFDLDPCKDLGPSTSCMPADTCRAGACDAQLGCSSAPLVCSTPMQNTCVNANTLRVYQGNGTCSNGMCDYAPKDVACPNCPSCDPCSTMTCDAPPSPAACYKTAGTCSNGSCSYAFANSASCDDGNACTTGDTCSNGACTGTAIACNTKPAAICFNATTQRTYTTPGTCGGGACTYAPIDTSCKYGCTSGACVVPAVGTVTEFSTPASGESYSITAGPDGNLWFTEYAGNKIGRITTAGVVTEFALPNAFSFASGITSGPDGNLWFAEGGGRIGRMTTAGVLTEWGANGTPFGIAAGPDGNLWFTELTGDRIGQITTSGTIATFSGLTSGCQPRGISAGPDGNLWFTEYAGDNIGRITTSGTATEFGLPTSQASPLGIAQGPDGNLWFTEYDGNNIGKITTTGVITEFALPAKSTGPDGIAQGPDGNLWFAEKGNIGRITTAGVISVFAAAAPSDDAIASGPDGNMWFTDNNGKIGMIVP